VQLYCANCDSSSLGETPANNRAIDFVCPRCRAPFQLKAKHSALGETVTDGAYTAMVAAIREDRTPNLLLMRYALATWEVRDLLLIPSFMFSESAVIKRKPLSATARRAGWVGCNIDLHRIAPEARIAIVIIRSSSRRRGDESLTKKQNQRFLTSSPTNQTVIVPPEEVRARYTRLKPIREIKTAQRGWTLDVLNIVRRLVESRRRGDESLKSTGQPESLRLLTSSPTNEFTTADAYAFTRELEKLHPDNRHVRDNPVKDFISRGRNPPTTSSLERHGIAAPHRAWRLAPAVRVRVKSGHQLGTIESRSGGSNGQINGKIRRGREDEVLFERPVSRRT
jgi:type II restriction enzyme